MSDLIELTALILAAFTVILVGIGPIYAAHQDTDNLEGKTDPADHAC